MVRGWDQGNRANRLCCDEAGEVVVVPCGDLSAEAYGVLAGRSARQVQRHVFDGGELAGAWSVRMRHSSSRKTMSMTQCRLFSTAQWLRTIMARLLAGRLSDVMKSRVSRSIVRPIARMLSTMTTPFKPGQSWRSCNQETSCRTGVFRVSMRP